MTITTSNSTDTISTRDAYRAAVEDWIRTIRTEEDLAFASPDLREVDFWRRAHFREEEADPE